MRLLTFSQQRYTDGQLFWSFLKERKVEILVFLLEWNGFWPFRNKEKTNKGFAANKMSGYICPNCKNSIHDDDALLCHFCGESLQRASKGFLGKVRYSNQKVIWFFVVFLVLLGFIILMVR